MSCPSLRDTSHSYANQYLDEVASLVLQRCRMIEVLWREKFESAGMLTDAQNCAMESILHIIENCLRGKLVRPALCYLGYLAVDVGEPCEKSYDYAVMNGAALELFHLSALIQDDVMDASNMRRGILSLRAFVYSELKNNTTVTDDSLIQRAADGVATVVGDSLITEAWYLVAQLPSRCSDEWRSMMAAVHAGQTLDLYCSVLENVVEGDSGTTVALKTGAYSIHFPTRLGAIIAGANSRELSVLAKFCRHVSTAFCLRDDYLDIWGDPEMTGKPTLLDVRDGKKTSVYWRAEEILSGDDLLLLRKVVCDGSVGDSEIAELINILSRSGVGRRLEKEIREEYEQACVALRSDAIRPYARCQLQRQAHELSFRSR